MNGRAYDYNLGRFYGVDPFIQFPSNSQSLNPYSYLMNNPLSGTDPTGYLKACDTLLVCSTHQILDKNFNKPITALGSENTESQTKNGAQNGQESKPTSQIDGSRDGPSGIGAGARKKISDESGQERLSAENLKWARPLRSAAWPRAIKEIRDESMPLRPLNDGEKEFFNGIFNNLNVSSIRLGTLDTSKAGENTLAVTIGNTIMFASEFGIDKSITTWDRANQSTAVHEVVHVWDSQNTSLNTWINAAQAQDRALEDTGDSDNAYKYNARDLRQFGDANPESRASQVEDAWRRSVGLPSIIYPNFNNLQRSAIPNELLRREIDNEN